MEALKVSDESTENGIASCRIQSSRVEYTGPELLSGNKPFFISQDLLAIV
jgi:hypothetical protein